MNKRSERLEHLAYASPDIFGDRLAEVMNDIRVSGAQLANDGVCNKDAVASYRRNERLPNGRTLLYLCSYLNVSADWLLGLSNEKRTIW